MPGYATITAWHAFIAGNDVYAYYTREIGTANVHGHVSIVRNLVNREPLLIADHHFRLTLTNQQIAQLRYAHLCP